MARYKGKTSPKMAGNKMIYNEMVVTEVALPTQRSLFLKLLCYVCGFSSRFTHPSLSTNRLVRL
jgi:hypothetical protein